jgi:hypothetical protein
VRSWSLLLAGAAIAIGVAAHAEAPRTFKSAQYSDPLLRKDALSKATDSFVPAALQKKLDDVLATKDYVALAKSLAQTPPVERIAWLTSRLYDGKTAFLGYALLRDLWGLAQVKNPALDESASTAVGLVALYVFQVHLLDGAMCEDVSAPGPRLSQYLTAFRPVFLGLKSKSVEEKQKLIKGALQAEQKSRRHRHGDDYLCRGGMAEFQASVEQLGPNVTVGELAAKYGEKSKSGLGTDVRLPPPAKTYEPKFLPPEKYGPKQHELRMNLVGTLVELLR